MSDWPEVSVVVPTYQRRASVMRLLEALGDQTLPARHFEVVVVIDGSDDGTREAVARYEACFVVRWLTHENRGRAATVNAGAAVARGEIIVILDDDMEPAPDLLAAHLREHARAGSVGVIGSAPVRMNALTPPFARFTGVRFNSVLTELAARPWDVSFAETYTGNFSVRATHFRRIGGYDEAFDGYGLEDYELALRLVTSGVQLVLSAEAVAYQNYDKTFAQAARDSESRGRSALIFAGLHPAFAARVVDLSDPTRPTCPRRLLRYVLPRMTRLVPILPRLVVWSVGIAERRRTGRLAFAYQLGLEYFYLLGWRAAARTGEATGRDTGR